MKTVFSNSEIDHVWARQTQDYGKNPAGNVFFKGTKIYSYGHHFCMANIVKPGIVLITTRTYSNTTAKHLRGVSYAVNHMERVYVPDPESVSNSMEYWTKQIKYSLEVLGNSRKRETTKQQERNELRQIVSNAERMFELFGFKVGKKWDFEDDKRKEFLLYFNAAKTEQGSQGLADKLARLKENERRKDLKKKRESLARWLNVPYKDTVKLDPADVYLRLIEQEDEQIVETSKGARVSLKAANTLFKMIQAGKDIKGFDVDGYTVIGINGVLRVGCHEITRKEINRFSSLMSWGTINEH